MNTKEKGNISEQTVCNYLEKNGYRIIERNYSCTFGEIDIIAEKNDVLCAVEVKKYPVLWDLSDIQYKIPLSKQIRIKKTLSYYLAHENNNKYHCIRFDAVAVMKNDLQYWEGAF